MAKEPGWWSISYTVEPSEADLEHIAELVSEGYREGEIVADAPEDEDEDD